MKCKIDMKDMLLNKPTMNYQTNKWNIGMKQKKTTDR